MQQRVELRFDRDWVWIEHRGADGRALPAQLRRGDLAAGADECAPSHRRRCTGDPGRRTRRSCRRRWPITPSCAHEREDQDGGGRRAPALPALKMKAPRVLERLEQTAARAREERWPYEQFLEALSEAEVFARDASGARQRIRHAAFPAHKTLEDFDFTAQPGAEKPLILHLAQLALDRRAQQRLLLRAAGHRQDAPVDRLCDQGLPGRASASRSRPPSNGSTASNRRNTATRSTTNSDGSSATR